MSKLLKANKPLLYVLIFQLLILGCSSRTSYEGEPAIFIKNITLIDAVNGLSKNQGVLVRGNKIVEVGPVNEVSVPHNASIIDYTGKYMIPGLWDAHMHLTNNKSLNPVIYRLFLINGITYIRDTSGKFELLQPLLDKAAKMKGIAPDIFITGPHIDGEHVSWSSSVSATSVERAKQLVDTLIKAGVDQIKTYELLAPDVYSAVLSRANSKGYKVSGHIPLTMDAIEALGHGLSSVEHLNNLELSMSSDWDSLLQERRRIISNGDGKTGGEIRHQIYQAQRLHALKTQDEKRREEVLKSMADNNTWQVPTLVILTAQEQGMYAREEYRETFKFLPEPLRSNWEKYAEELAPLSEVDSLRANWANEIVASIPDAGIPIMAGTDAPLFSLTPGFSLHEELALLVHAGLTPMQAIEAATLRPAEFFGLEDQQGTIDKGMNADFVILDSNPLDDIRNTISINAVMREGRHHKKEDLDRMRLNLEQGKYKL